jgi:ribosomal protein L11 methyltransferase
MEKWNKFTIDTTTEAVDAISYQLGEMGIQGIEVIDHVPLSEEDRKTMYVDLLPDDIAPDDGTAKVVCYVDEDADVEALVADISVMMQELGQFLNVGDATISLGETKDEDWVNNWKKYFKPFRLDDNIIIKPTWEVLEDQKEDDIVVEIDPGTAFGTGSHETTKLCIHQLKKHIKEDTMLLDLGCGSGILSIIGLKLGVKQAVGTDIDPNAISATKENCEINGITKEQMTAYQGNLLTDEEFCKSLGTGCYDIVVANILADVIIPLCGIVTPFLKEDGLFVTSGIINTKEADVVAAMTENHLEIIEINHMKDWVSITARPKR